MPSKVFYICGDSAVGKLRLITKLWDDCNGLRLRFGIGTPLEAYIPEVECRCHPRFLAVESADVSASHADTILFKWQKDYDRRVQELIEVFPKSEHRIVLLWRPWNEHSRDYQRKHPKRARNGSAEYLRTRWEPDGVIGSRFGINGSFRALGVPIELVDASTPDYVALGDWPID